MNWEFLFKKIVGRLVFCTICCCLLIMLNCYWAGHNILDIFVSETYRHMRVSFFWYVRFHCGFVCILCIVNCVIWMSIVELNILNDDRQGTGVSIFALSQRTSYVMVVIMDSPLLSDNISICSFHFCGILQHFSLPFC